MQRDKKVSGDEVTRTEREVTSVMIPRFRALDNWALETSAQRNWLRLITPNWRAASWSSVELSTPYMRVLAMPKGKRFRQKSRPSSKFRHIETPHVLFRRDIDRRVGTNFRHMLPVGVSFRRILQIGKPIP